MPRFIRQRGTIDIYDVEALLYQKVMDACKNQANLFNYIFKDSTTGRVPFSTFERTIIFISPQRGLLKL